MGNGGGVIPTSSRTRAGSKFEMVYTSLSRPVSSFQPALVQFTLAMNRCFRSFCRIPYSFGVPATIRFRPGFRVSVSKSKTFCKTKKGSHSKNLILFFGILGTLDHFSILTG